MLTIYNFQLNSKLQKKMCEFELFLTLSSTYTHLHGQAGGLVTVLGPRDLKGT